MIINVIIARPAINRSVASAEIYRVIAAACIQQAAAGQIGAGHIIQQVVAITTNDGVVARAEDDGVIARATIKVITARSARDSVIPALAPDRYPVRIGPGVDRIGIIRACHALDPGKLTRRPPAGIAIAARITAAEGDIDARGGLPVAKPQLVKIPGIFTHVIGVRLVIFGDDGVIIAVTAKDAVRADAT